MENNLIDTYRIVSCNALYFLLNGKYCLLENGYPYEFEQYAEFADNKILFNGDYYDELFFVPSKKENNDKRVSQFCFMELGLPPNSCGRERTYSGYLRILPIKDHLEVFNIQ